MKGNITIEASYIFPFCFLLIGIVCYLGVSLYNRSVLKLTAYECVLQTVQEYDDESSEAYLMKIAEEYGKQRAFSIKELQVRVRMTVSKITVTYTASQSAFEIPIQVTAIYEKTFPETMLRLTKEKTGENHERNIETGTE